MTQRAIDGDFVYFVTVNVKNRRWYFVLPERAEKLGQAIQTCCRIKQFELLAYCILPNHVHLLVRKLRLDEAPAHRTLGSVRCEKVATEKCFLYPHRRLPSRRSIEKRPTLSDLMHSIKSTFSQTLRQGSFWQHRSNFRIIESDEYLRNGVEYIRYNYRKMALPERYSQPPFVFLDERKVAELF